MNKKLGRLLYPQTWVYFVVMALFALTTLLMEQYILGAVEAVVTILSYIVFAAHRRNRQKEVLEAMFQQVKDTSVTKLPSVAEMVLSQCQTSLSTQDIMNMGLWAVGSKPSIENMSVPNKEIPSKGQTINGSWQYVYDLELASKEMEKFILEKGFWYLLPAGCSFNYSCEKMLDHLYFHFRLCDLDEIDLLNVFKKPSRSHL